MLFADRESADCRPINRAEDLDDGLSSRFLCRRSFFVDACVFLPDWRYPPACFSKLSAR